LDCYKEYLLKEGNIMVNDISFDELSIGDSAELTKIITDEDVHAFANISMDHNPIHLDKDFAKTTQFKQPIAHGMLSASLISAVIGTVLPGRNTIYLGQTLKFTAPVFIGDTLSAKISVAEKHEGKNIIKLVTQVFNQADKLVIDGHATVLKK
jgi:3-hydroxybutyryl-CoA dehydratase